MRLLVLLLALLFLPLPVAVHAQAPSLDEVRAMLSTYEAGPSDAEWRRLGRATIDALIAIHRNPAEPAHLRLRAVSAAGAFRTEAARRFLRAVAADPASGPLTIRAAIGALGRAFGGQAVSEVVPFLAHDNPVVREGAARTLARMSQYPEARRALEARVALETDPAVRRALDVR